MVKKSRKKIQRAGGGPTRIGDEIFRLLEAMGGSKERSRLKFLWEKWPEVVGEEIAAQVEVIGHKNGVLILGVEDAMQLQEMSFYSEEILARSNTFLRGEFFRELRLEVIRRK